MRDRLSLKLKWLAARCQLWCSELWCLANGCKLPKWPSFEQLDLQLLCDFLVSFSLKEAASPIKLLILIRTPYIFKP